MVSQASQRMLSDGMSPFSTARCQIGTLHQQPIQERGGARTRPADGEKQKQQIVLKACLHPLQSPSNATEKVSTMHLSLAGLQLLQCKKNGSLTDNCISHLKKYNNLHRKAER